MDRQPVSFDDLRHWLNAVPDRRSRMYTITCPVCGEGRPGKCQMWPDRVTQQGTAGWRCLICGAGGTLGGLAAKTGYQPDEDYHPRPAPAPQPTPAPREYAWKARAEELTARYAAAGDRVALWQAYKPLTAAIITAHRLGVGVLPASKCAQRRLIVPLVDFTGRVVGFRGRLIGPSCGKCLAAGEKCAKWLSPGGNTATLYNWQALRPGGVVFILENAVDSLLFTAKNAPQAVAVATLSVSYRDPAWIEWLKRAAPGYFVVGYDNDAPGQATRRDILQEWQGVHHCPPPLNGFKLYELLTEAGLRGEVYRWPDSAPVKADFGDYL